MSGSRHVGFWGAVGTLVGYVIGASIFVLPAQLLPSLGSGLVLAYALAAVPAIFTCAVGAVIGNAFPVSGATYQAVRDVLGERTAFVVAWLLLWAAALGTALVAYGLADYAAYLLPGIDARACALVVTALFALVNLTPASVTVGVQGAMVLGFAFVIAGFTAGGLLSGEWSAMQHPVAGGWSGVVGGAAAAYFSYAGLQVLIDIGGDIREPGRTIPRAMLTSFLVVLLLYGGFTTAVVMLANGGGDATAPALVGRLAAEHFGAWAGQAIVWSALLAAATSINGIFFTQARDLQALAADGRLPAALAAAPGGIPRAAVLSLAAMALAATAMGGTVRDYAVLTALCLMVIQGVLGLTAMRIPARVPDAWSRSEFRPGPRLLNVIGWGLVVVSLLFFIAGASQDLGNLSWFAGLLVVGLLASRVTSPTIHGARPA